MKIKLQYSIFFVLFFLFTILQTLSVYGQFKPNHILGLKLWLRADSGVVLNGNHVSKWLDCSGDSNNMLPSTLANQPNYVSSVSQLNNKPALHFDGYDDYLISSPIITNDKISVFIVCKSYSNTQSIGALSLFNSALIHDWNNSNSIIVFSIQSGAISAYRNSQSILYTNSIPSTYAIYNLIGDGSSLKTYFNTYSVNQVPSLGYYDIDKVVVGCRYSSGEFNYFINMDIFEIIIYDSALNASEIKLIESYLNEKYAPPVNLGPDIVISYGFCEKTIDAGSQYKHYLWSTGDTTQSIQVSDNGSYSVTVSNIFNVISVDTINIYYPKIDLVDTFLCIGNSLQLTTGLSGNYFYNWSNSETSPLINVTSSGLYSVTVSDTNFCQTTSDSIIVYEDDFPITAGLGADSINICTGNFIGLVTPSPLPANLTYNWSTLEFSPEIEISTSGIYSVTVLDSNECIAKDTISVNIIGTAPSAYFSHILRCSEMISDFTNTSIPPGISWFWNFGDGYSDTVQNPSHIYISKGNYTVSLTVTDGLCSSTFSEIIYIKGSPTASFITDTTCFNHPYYFSDQSSSNDGNIISWDWDFGDSSPHNSAQNPIHQYVLAGTYWVQLTVTNDSSCSSNIYLPIVVVDSATVPGIFSLIQPVDNYIAPRSQIMFTWNNSTNADSYTLMYSTDSLFLSNVETISSIQSTTYVLSFPTSQTYFWRVSAKNICGNQTVSVTRKISFFSSAFISNMQLWLKADSGVEYNENIVSGWKDCSNNNYHAIQNNFSFRPELIPESLNGYPTIRFDGINDYLMSNISISTNNMSFFIVCKNMSNNNNAGALSLFPSLSSNDYDNSNSFIGLANINGGICAYRNWVEASYVSNSHNSFAIYNLIADGAFLTTYFNTVNSSHATSSGNFIFNNVLIGGRWVVTPCLFMNSEIAEIIVFDAALSTQDQKKVEDYFQFKYAPPVNLGPDINISYGLCDTTLDAGGRYTHFLWSTGDTSQILSISQPGNYSVTATNIFGQLSIDSVIVSMPKITVHDTTFCLGDTIQIAGNSGSGYSYFWLPDSLTSNTLIVSSPGTYSLTIFDTNGCQQTKSFQVVADSFAVTSTLGPDKKICKGDYIGLVHGAQDASDYLWSNGSGNSLLVINDPIGTLPVYSVTVNNNNGCLFEDTIHLTINGIKPNADFISDSVCFGNSSHFTNLSTVAPPFQIVNYNWNFGDNTFSNLPNPIHLFAGDGYHQVALTVTTDSGCMNSAQHNIIVFSKPEVNFLPYMGCTEEPISFVDKTTCPFGSITSWYWKFNDPLHPGQDTSTYQNPVYTFDTSGVYAVKVISISGAGCTDSATKNVSIKQSPGLNFSFTDACAEHSIYFNDLIDLQPWETILSYDWQFGDGSSSSIANPIHVFDTAGIYNTSFTVRTSSGCEVKVIKPIDVGGDPNVDFIYGNNCVFNLTQFSDNSQVTNGIINAWYWNFDDLGNAVIPNPSFLFPDTGNYLIRLRVQTDHNCSDSVDLPVKIVAAPMALFTLSPEYGVPPLSVTFNNNSIGATSYFWSFGDSQSSTLTHPVHTYQNQGIFNVVLSAYNAIGCSDTVSAKVYVLPTSVDIAVVSTTVDENNGQLFVTAELLNKGTRKIEHIDMAVDFGNGNILHEQWMGTLLEGETLHYVFDVSFEIPKDVDVNFVCVEALLPELTDDNPNNNFSCVALNDDLLILDPYPNPVTDFINFPYILPFSDQVAIDISDGTGHFVKEIYSGSGYEGYNQIQVDLTTLHSGVYCVRISFRDKILRKKFVKM